MTGDNTDDNVATTTTSKDEEPSSISATTITPTAATDSPNGSSNTDTSSSSSSSNYCWCCSKERHAKIMSYYWEHEFLLLIVIAILVAKAYPPLGAEYLKPDITATWIAVIIIFLLAGLSLKTSEFTNAMFNWRYNILVQLFNFGIVSALAYGVSRALQQSTIIGTDLADGMVVCACMPMTISMVVVLTKAANGDEASSIFNSAVGNFIGVFLSPLLILGYLGVSGDIDLVRVFYQLTLRVLLPGIVGQVLQQFASIKTFASSHKFLLKQVQTYSLIFIVYTVFCETFADDTGSSIGDIFLMIVFQLLILITVMIMAWYMLRFLYRNQPKLRVAGLYCCTHKTVAIGIPLITAIYSDTPGTASKVGLYTLPLLIWHPLQLIIGTLLAPKLAKFVDVEEKRLFTNTSDDININVTSTNTQSVDNATNTIEEGQR